MYAIHVQSSLYDLLSATDDIQVKAAESRLWRRAIRIANIIADTYFYLITALGLKVLDQITFFDHLTYLNFFEISVPIDGSYFSYSHFAVWRSKIRYLRRNN